VAGCDTIDGEAEHKRISSVRSLLSLAVRSVSPMNTAGAFCFLLSIVLLFCFAYRKQLL
jgi:hypothetical protein